MKQSIHIACSPITIGFGATRTTGTSNGVMIFDSAVNTVSPGNVTLTQTASIAHTMTIAITGDSNSVCSYTATIVERNIFTTGAALKTGTVALTGGPPTLVGTGLTESDLLNMRVTWDGGGAKDDGAGTITGSAGALLERPDHLYKWALTTYTPRVLSAITTPAEFTVAEASFYKLAGVLTEKIALKDFLQRLAWQARCYSYQAAGVSTLIWRPDTIAAAKTLTDQSVRRAIGSNVTSLRRGRSRLEDVINYVEILYDRDPTGELGWRKNTKNSDAASITKYGQRERPGHFEFDLVSDDATAADVRDFYLARYKDQHRLARWESFLNQAEIDFSAKIALTHPLLYGGALTGEIIEADLIPGSKSEPDHLALTLMGV